MADRWWVSLAPEASGLRARGRAHTTRGVVSAAVLAVGVLGSVVSVLHTPAVNQVHATDYGMQVAAVGDALRAGCGPLNVVTAPSSKVASVQTTSVLPYDTTVPVAGWFYPDLPSASESAPAPEAVLREMWQGRKVAWVAPDAPASVAAQVRELAAAHPEWDLRVATWPSHREQLDGPVAFATWGATITCKQASASVAEQVWAAGTLPPGRPGQTPPAILTPKGASS